MRSVRDFDEVLYLGLIGFGSDGVRYVIKSFVKDFQIFAGIIIKVNVMGHASWAHISFYLT